MSLTLVSNPSNECHEELSAQSDSPYGMVTDSESLGRMIYRTDQIKNGSLTPAAFPIKDLTDPNRGGMSVARLNHMSQQDRVAQIKTFESNPENKIQGIAVAKTLEIRNLRSICGQRLFCVIDDAKTDFEAHALLRLENKNMSAPRRARKTLMDLIQIHPRIKFIHG